MLLMFAVGMGNLGWMLGLGAIMAIEKNPSWGRRIGLPVGLAFVGFGATSALNGAPL
jgi:predicted metal-binding membrane protein